MEPRLDDHWQPQTILTWGPSKAIQLKNDPNQASESHDTSHCINLQFLLDGIHLYNTKYITNWLVCQPLVMQTTARNYYYYYYYIHLTASFPGQPG